MVIPKASHNGYVYHWMLHKFIIQDGLNNPIRGNIGTGYISTDDIEDIGFMHISDTMFKPFQMWKTLSDILIHYK